MANKRVAKLFAICEYTGMTPLARHLSENKGSLSQRALAQQLDISESYLSQLAGGTRRPSLNLAFRMERVLGIPAGEWLQTEPGE